MGEIDELETKYIEFLSIGALCMHLREYIILKVAVFRIEEIVKFKCSLILKC